MKKRLFSILAVLVMVMCLAPATVLADTYHCEGCGADVTEKDLKYTDKGALQHEVMHTLWTCGRAKLENHTWSKEDGKCTKCERTCNHLNKDNDHYCDICGKQITAHTGGTATCKEQATCDTCHEKYGELKPHELTHVDAKAATVAEVGNEEYWVCNVCNKYFGDADATEEIESSKTVIAKLAPTIINSDGQTVTVSEKTALTFTSDAPFEDFIRVELDGKTVDSNNYTVKSGSTIVTLNADYVATLATGEHTLGIVSQGGTATEKFTITQKATETTTTTAKDETTTTTVKAETTATTTSAKTGDNSNLGLWITLLCVSGGAVTVTALVSKKKNYNR